MDKSPEADDPTWRNASTSRCASGCDVPGADSAGAPTTRTERTCTRCAVKRLSIEAVSSSGYREGKLRTKILGLLALLIVVASGLPCHAQSIRERLRPKDVSTAAVSEAQAIDITLTTTRAVVQPIQAWIRTAATAGPSTRILTAELNDREGVLVQLGQRARAFQLSSRSSMYQARVTRVTRGDGRWVVQATLAAGGPSNNAPFILEIVVDRGRFLAVPNVAIIEEGAARIVYVQHHPGHYLPTKIDTGIQGELYTQVLHGLEEGAEVVTFGSFFVDAEYKLKSSGGRSHEHHQH